MFAAIPWIGRGAVWVLSSIGALKVGETALKATSNDSESGGPGLMAWAMVLAVLAFAIWLAVRMILKRKGAA